MTFVGLIALAGCLLQTAFIMVEHEKKYVPAVVLKGCASVMFCVIGFLGFDLLKITTLNLVEPELDAALYYKLGELVFIGLVLGGIGDILLNLRFVFEKKGQIFFLAGIAAFLAGHIVYMVSLIKVSTAVLIPTVCGIIAAAILLFIIFKTFEVKIAFKIFGVLYIGAVCLMAAYAIGNFITSLSVFSLVYALGAVFFLVSDVVLIFNTFGKTQRFSLRITNLSLYYIGQLLIAFSLFCIR